MKELFKQRGILRNKLFLMLGVCLCVYFAYHSIQGERSIMNLVSLESQIEQSEQKLAALQERSGVIQARVNMMRPGSINKDLLEEQVRRTLGYKHPDEWVVRSNNSDVSS